MPARNARTNRDVGARQEGGPKAPTGEHQAADNWGGASHVKKRLSSSETHANGAAGIGCPQELPTHRQKDKSSDHRRLVGLIIPRSELTPKLPHRTLNRITQKPIRQNILGLCIIMEGCLRLLLFHYRIIRASGIFSRSLGCFLSFSLYIKYKCNFIKQPPTTDVPLFM